MLEMDWSNLDLVDPRGAVASQDSETAEDSPTDMRIGDPWPIVWRTKKVGLLSNRKPNADTMLYEAQAILKEANPELSFVYGSKEPLATNAETVVIDRLKQCDVVVLASAECGGCTSWVCQDLITLSRLGVPCVLIVTNHFVTMARHVLRRGGVETPHLLIPKHPVSGITDAEAAGKIRELSRDLLVQIGEMQAA